MAEDFFARAEAGDWAGTFNAYASADHSGYGTDSDAAEWANAGPVARLAALTALAVLSSEQARAFLLQGTNPFGSKDEDASPASAGRGEEDPALPRPSTRCAADRLEDWAPSLWRALRSHARGRWAAAKPALEAALEEQKNAQHLKADGLDALGEQIRARWLRGFLSAYLNVPAAEAEAETGVSFAQAETMKIKGLLPSHRLDHVGRRFALGPAPLTDAADLFALRRDARAEARQTIRWLKRRLLVAALETGGVEDVR
jgi:hypothetical protein